MYKQQLREHKPSAQAVRQVAHNADYYYYYYYYTAGNTPYVNSGEAMNRRRGWSSWWSPSQVLANNYGV